MVPETKNTCEQVFGKRLKELRKEHGCTIEQFADMVGISKSTLVNALELSLEGYKQDNLPWR